MFRAVARPFRTATDGTPARRRESPLSKQSQCDSRPREKFRLGAGALGKSFPRARLQAQRLADAKSGGDETALDTRRGFGFCHTGGAGRREWPAGGGTDAGTKECRPFFAPRMRFLVA